MYISSVMPNSLLVHYNAILVFLSHAALKNKHQINMWVMCSLFHVKDPQVALDISGSPIDSQWGSLKYPG